MNVGEKVSLYKEKLGFKNFQEYGKAIGVSGEWLLNLSKTKDAKTIDVNNFLKVSNYFGISINDLLTDDESSDSKIVESVNIDNNDIGVIIGELIAFLDKKESIRIDGILLNDKAKKTCIDSLEVTKMLVKQCL